MNTPATVAETFTTAQVQEESFAQPLPELAETADEIGAGLSPFVKEAIALADELKLLDEQPVVETSGLVLAQSDSTANDPREGGLANSSSSLDGVKQLWKKVVDWAAEKPVLGKIVALGTTLSVAVATMPNAFSQTEATGEDVKTPGSGFPHSPYYIAEGLAVLFFIMSLPAIGRWWRRGNDHAQSWKDRPQNW